jgi:hypothetical protein
MDVDEQLHISPDFSAEDRKLGKPQSRSEQIESNEIGISKGKFNFVAVIGLRNESSESCDVTCIPLKVKILVLPSNWFLTCLILRP